ncbi:efflux RND transporter periplasmic adaptor subunit [uncultured Hymenobacter sp.]|uniref:efflux RND transporter periplasmic adaptor subunit n=1 Tax=uncultured Hymenobacter sp. TaxID=170016 RepID=UPI0035CC5B2A
MPENLIQETGEIGTLPVVTETTVAGPASQFSPPTTTAPAATPSPTPPPPPKARGGAWRWWLLALAVVAALVFVKMRYFPTPAAGGKDAKGGPGAAGGSGANQKGGPGAAGAGGGRGAGAKTPVSAFVVATTSLADEVAATGSVLAEEAVTIRSEVPGKITSFTIREGQAVRKGQLLFTINAADIQAQLQKLATNQKLYADQERRQRTLLNKEFISAQEYEQSAAQLQAARADRAALQATLAKTYVRAPFDGVLGLTTTTVGTYVSPGDEITTLSRTRPVKIAFQVPGRFAAVVKRGDEVKIKDEGSGKTYSARVYALDPQIDPVSRTLPVRARFANTKDELRPGAFVKVSLQLSEASNAIQIPTEAITPEAAGYSVFLIKNGKAVKQPVKIGVRSERLIQITNGLAVGDSVARTGILQLKPGDAVRATK